MILREKLEKDGGVLFRWRSFLPLVLVPLAIVAAFDSGVFVVPFDNDADEAWILLCMAVSLTGFGVRVMAAGFAPRGTSGRNTHQQRAEALNTTGIYSMVRHPLYLGNFLVFLGFLLAIQVWWFVLLGTLLYILYYERIMMAEETFLADKFGAAYVDWAARTPAIMLNPMRWRRPALSFSLRSVLRREYNGFFLIIVFFFINEVVSDLIAGGQSLSQWIAADTHWLYIFAFGTVLFVVLRTLKRYTGLLTVEGR